MWPRSRRFVPLFLGYLVKVLTKSILNRAAKLIVKRRKRVTDISRLYGRIIKIAPVQIPRGPCVTIPAPESLRFLVRSYEIKNPRTIGATGYSRHGRFIEPLDPLLLHSSAATENFHGRADCRGRHPGKRQPAGPDTNSS